MAEEWFENKDAFYADDERRHSPEWDFGVMWRERDDGSKHPQWRVSWLCDTGEVYAIELSESGRVILLGAVPAIGEYPANSPQLRWEEWAKRQREGIERVMDGWAEGEIHKPLSWVRKRLGSAQAQRIREAVT